MGLFSFEHSRTAYLADFAVHGIATLALAVALVTLASDGQAWAVLALVASGWVGWSLAEYLLHHRTGRQPGRKAGYFGITTLVWDRLFGTLPRFAVAPPFPLPPSTFDEGSNS